MKQSLTLLFPTSSLSSYLPLYQGLKGQKIISCRILAGDYKEVSLGKFFSDLFFQVPVITQQSYLSKVKSICRQNQVSILWPLAINEILIINQERNFFQSNNIHIITCPRETIDICIDKLKLANWFKQNMVLTPKLITDLSEVKPAKKYVSKPRRSHADQKFEIIEGKEIQLVNSHIVQEYINGQEITADCLVGKAGQLIALVIRERLLVWGGQSKIGRTVKSKEIANLTSRIIRLLPCYGLINIQFIKTRGRLYVLEINPRPAMGGLALSLKAGVNFPLLLIKDLLNLPIKPQEIKYRENLRMIRYITEHYYYEK
jgi:carbamoyl-phosphate synthase large subunit